MDLALNQFIFNRINFVNIIREHQALGAHTDIIVFQSTMIKTYRWTHPGARPMGNRNSNQCSSCHRLKTLSPKRNNDDQFSIALKCSECNWEKKFKVAEGFRWCQGESPSKGGDRGAWLVFAESNSGVSDSGDREGENMDTT
jgi:hypothetical protein